MKRDKVFKSKNDWLFYLAIAILPTLHFSIFYLGVNFSSIRLAFLEMDEYGKYSVAGFKNFIAFFEGTAGQGFTQYMSYIKNSVIYYLVGLFIGTPITLIFAYYIHKDSVGSGIFKVILYLPHILSMTVVVIMFKFFASTGYPMIVKAITGVAPNGLLTDYPFATILVFTIWASRGTGVLMYTGAMAGIDESIVESASLDGAGPFQEFLHIFVPLIFPTLSTFLIIGVASIFVEQMNLFTFYKWDDINQKAVTMGYYLYAIVQHWSTPKSMYPFLSAIGLMLTIVTALLTFVYQKVLNKIDPMR